MVTLLTGVLIVTEELFMVKGLLLVVTAEMLFKLYVAVPPAERVSRIVEGVRLPELVVSAI